MSVQAWSRKPLWAAALIVCSFLSQTALASAENSAVGLGVEGFAGFAEVLDQVHNLGRQLQATSGTTCPSGYRTPLRGTTNSPPATGSVPYSSLRSYGWDVPTTRPLNSVPSASADYWDIVCTSFNSQTSYTQCGGKNPLDGGGAVHLRYSCTDNNMWILTYVFSAYTFQTTFGDLWAVYNCPSTGCKASSDKFVQFTGTEENASCQSTCSASTTGCSGMGQSCWCCQDVWLIKDGTSYVGWMAKVTFTRGPGATTSYSPMMTHFDYVYSGSQTGASTGKVPENGVCLNCAAPPPPPPSPSPSPAPGPGPGPLPIDVRVIITATPATGLLGSRFNFTIDMSNVAGITSTGNNGFVITLPAEVTPTGGVTAGTGTPTPSCVTMGSVTTGWTINCSLVAELGATAAWTFTLPANSSTLGAKTATVQLMKPDDDPTNNFDDATYAPFVNCGAPYGVVAPRPACPALTFYVGPDSASLTSSDAFGQTCCVQRDVAVNITAVPTTSLLGSDFSYTVNMSNVLGVTSPGNNSFVVTLPAGVTPTGPVVAVGTGIPTPVCVTSGSVSAGWTLNCSVVADMGAAAAWTFTLPANSSALGAKVASVQLLHSDSHPLNNFDDATYTPTINCGAPYGVISPRPACPAGSTYVGPDSASLTDSATFGSSCCVLVDVAINITATPTIAEVGSNVTCTVNITNVGPGTSAGPNGFIITLPPGILVVDPGQLTPTSTVTPQVTCVASGTNGVDLVLNCTVNSDLTSNTTWEWTFPATGTTSGPKTAIAELTQPDSNPSNNKDDALVEFFLTCGNPFGNGTFPACPVGSTYVGPNNQGIAASTDFAAVCCGLLDVAIDKSVSPATAVTGTTVNYTVVLSNAGPTAVPALNGFRDALPAGMTFIGPVTAKGGAPEVVCSTSGNNVTGTTVECTTTTILGLNIAWTYTYLVQVTTPGVLINRAEVLNPDSNSTNNNDTAPVTVFGTCGNPFGTGVRPDCGVGFVYQGPDSAVLDDPLVDGAAEFKSECCVAAGDLPGETSITATPCKGYALGQPVTLNFTVTAEGPGSSGNLALAATWPPAMNVVSAVLTDPSGQVNYTELQACGEIDVQDDSAMIACSIFDLLPPNQAVLTLTYLPTTAKNYTVVANVEPFDDPTRDSDSSNNQAQTCANVLDCPPYLAVVGQSCQPATCNPCADPNPTVYISTGSQAQPANGLWQIRDFANGKMALVPEFLCVIDGVVGQIGDIAVMHKGDVIVLDTAGNLRYIPVAILPTTPTRDYTRRCPTRHLYKFSVSYSGYTGLSVGYRSDMLMATTGDGWVVPLLIQESVQEAGSLSAGPLPGGSAEQPVRFGCWYASGSIVTNSGGTDITPGPDGNYYRWCAKDAKMDYTGTRYTTAFRDGYYQLTSSATNVGFVSNRLNDTAAGQAASFSNAGAFCTNTTVVGTGAFVRPDSAGVAESGAYAQFWAFGVDNGRAARAWPVSATTTSPSPIQVALLQARTVIVRNADGTPRKDALRVNGAAVKPVCQF